MERRKLTAESLSGRQISVAVLTAGLSPAAALAGETDWVWLLVWSAVGVALAYVALRRVGGHPIYRGRSGTVLFILYAGWSAVMASRVLGRAVQRLELTSGGSSEFWLMLLLAVPLFWISWGKAAPFFRTVEILWLAMAAVLVLVLGVGLTRVEWNYVLSRQGDWRSAAFAAGEILSSALFVLPYIYKVEVRSARKELTWLSALGIVAALLSIVTVGILGEAARRIPCGFFVAAGTLGKSARCEGLLAVLWILPDLTLAGMLCRVWGKRWWPTVGAVLACVLTLGGVGTEFPEEVYVIGSLVLLLLTLVFPRKKGEIVVGF